jgi:hypothetical protein
MKRQIALGLGITLALVVASTSVDAQLGGLLKKKAREAVEGKKDAPSPPPPPAATPETEKPATPPAARGDRAAAAPAKAAASPLEVSELPVRQSAEHVLRDGGESRANGDWDQLPRIPTAAVAAAYALGESARVALVDTVGTAVKTMVMSPTFLAEHEKYIKAEHQAVDHGLKGVFSLEDAMKKNDLKGIEAMQERQTIAMGVDQVRMIPPSSLKMVFAEDLAGWKKDAANPTRRDRAKFQKLVAKAAPLEALPADDEKFLRGYAVLKSIDNGGPDTEEAVFAIHERVTQEKEQLAYDDYNLKGQLKRNLAAFVAIAAKVNFNAQTANKSGTIRFVNAADEKQGALWKACFRAGEGPTAAAVKLARAWLAEL